MLLRLTLLGLFALVPAPVSAAPLPVLFVGDAGPHQPLARFRLLEPVFAERGIALTYQAGAEAFTPDNLKNYAAVMLYANIERIAPEQESALLEYVQAGGGFVPVHSASFCFHNSPKLIALTGAQFRAHETGVFRTTISAPDHAIVKGFPGFESWDETYTHHKHNPQNRTVLETRTDGEVEEPWTWVRTEGQGRVFYTAWGHDHRTWSHPGFHTLLERGVRWAAGQNPDAAQPYQDAPAMTPITGTETDFDHVPAKVPFYPAGEKWGTTAEPIGRMPKPLPPEKSKAHYTVPDGFRLELFAADADFQGGKPIAFAWDDRGRLFAAVTVDYPNEMQKPGQGRDKIVVLEDTTGDGNADTFTVFADNLSIPTSLAFAFGGVVVHQAPDTLFLKDTTGDGNADLRQTLFTGWGTQDTHAGPSNLRYGFDGHYTGMCGYSGFDGSVNGERVKFGQGFYRLKLARDPADEHRLTCEKLEFLRSTNNNSWGVGFTEDGKLMGSTANGCPVVHLAVPNRYFEATPGLSAGALANAALDNRYHPVTEKVRQVDWHGGFTSAAGCGIYTARVYPREYWNSAAFVSDPTGHLTATFQLQPAGAEVVARYGWNLLAGADEWAAPIDAQVGPDGQVWVLDWYNYIVQHNPTPAGFETGRGNAYETPLRDKKHGRIWRVVHAAGQPDPRPDLTTPDARITALRHPNLTWRLHAQRLLAEAADATITPKLLPLVADISRDELGLNPGALHAVHLLGQLGGPEAVPTAALAHPAAAVRRAAVQVGTPQPLAALDPDPTVRHAQLLRLATTDPTTTAGPLLADWLGDGFAGLLPAEHDAWVIAAAKQFEPLVLALADRNPSREAMRAIQQAARAAAGRDPALPDRVMAAGLPTNGLGAIVTGFATGLPATRKQSFTEAGQTAFVKLLATASADDRGALLRLAGRYDVAGLETQLAAAVDALLATATDGQADAASRTAAALQAVELRPENAAVGEKLAALLTADCPPEVATGLITALGQSRADGVGAAIIQRLPTLPPTVRPAAVRVALARPASAAAFLDAVEAGTIRFDLLALDQKAALGRHPDETIAARARKLLAQGGGLPDPDREKVIEAARPQLTRLGDVGKGRQVYATHCAKCHKHGDTGGNVGPDLTGMAAHPKEELLIAILDPSRSVEGNFRTYTVSTLEGRTITGLLASETKTAIEIIDAEGMRHPLQRDDIDTLTESTKSLMPEGFERQMTAAELGDLLEFLTLKGKYVPLPLDTVATITTIKGMFFGTEGTVERLIFPDYSPKTVEGVPFVLVNPEGGKPNAVMLHGPNGTRAPEMPKVVELPCNSAAKTIHLLGGVAGWGFPAARKGTTSLIVRLHYADGTTEDHELINGVHIADYVRRIDVPESKFAFDLAGRQVRTVSVSPKRPAVIERIELVKGPDSTAPVVLAVTVETP